MTFIPQLDPSKYILPKDTVVGNVYHYRVSNNHLPETLLRVNYLDCSGICFLVISNESECQGDIISFQPEVVLNLTPIKGELYMEIK